MRFRVLGPVALHAEEWLVPGPGLRCTLLGTLLAARSSAVSADALVETMWGEVPGDGAHARLQVHVHRLRRLLTDGDQLVREGSGYRLRLAPGDLDAAVFDDLADQVLDRVRAPEEVAALAAEALELWHGEAFEGAVGDLIDAEVARLNDRRRAVLEAKFAARLQQGEHREILDEVRHAAQADPLHEGLQAQLMAALAAAGRRSEALAAYRTTRRELVEELGIEPGHQLRSLHESILLGGQANTPDPPRPRQLPAPPPVLVGREEQLDRLDELMPAGDAGGTVLLTGAPGIGKTALALTWAHTRAERFTDGQLYVDLQGFGPGDPLPAGRVLTAFLRALGGPADAQHWPIPEQTTLLRSLVHGRRLLVLLDNAASVEQVRPLLAASAGCVVLVTSRLSLSGLALHCGARTLELPHLGEDSARELLGTALGEGTEAPTLAPLLECCAGLPLALAIVAERARFAPSTTAADLVDQITAAARRLDRFDLGEEDASLRSILSWSYRSLTPQAQLVFRSIGAFPGRRPDVGALAAISGMDYESAARAVDELVRAHLVSAEDLALRQHDLLRDLAAELAQAHGPALDEQTATRLVAYWAVRAAQARPRFAPEPVGALEVPELTAIDAPDFTDDERARRWVREHLLTMVEAAHLVPARPYPPFDRVLCVLSRMMSPIVAATGATVTIAPLTGAAQEAAERSGKTLDVVRARLQHATSLSGSDPQAAVTAFRTAIAFALQAGLSEQAAIGTGNLGRLLDRADDRQAAVEHYEEAARLAESAGAEPQANLWRCNIASTTVAAGDLASAEHHARLALEEAERLRSDREITAAAAVLGTVALHRGALDIAERRAVQAIEHARAKGLVFREADAELLFGGIAAERADVEAAADHFRRAVRLASEVRRLDIVVEAYLAWAEALAEHGSVDARSCLAEAGAVAQRSMERASMAAVQAKSYSVEQMLAGRAS